MWLVKFKYFTSAFIKLSQNIFCYDCILRWAWAWTPWAEFRNVMIVGWTETHWLKQSWFKFQENCTDAELDS